MISFDNTKIAFKAKSDQDLYKAYLLFKVMGNTSLTSIGKSLTEFAFKFHLPVKGIIKKTVFKQFCGGESIDDCSEAIENLGKYNVKALLDYSVEGKESEDEFNRTMKTILKTLEYAKTNTNIPFAVFKVTGVARFALLEKINAGKTLSAEEEKEFDHVKLRVDKICKKAAHIKIPVMIDAEESWIQDTIDELAQDMMRKYNKQSAIVYNTLQMYRWDRLDFLKKSHEDSKFHGYFLGVKIVRGAYMEKERERASKIGYASPIQKTKENSDKDYDLSLEYCVQNIAGISLCAGTHNEMSSMYLTKLMTLHKIDKKNTKIYFAQLLGMSDHISFNLSDADYNVVKYVPFGPVKDVMPYLLRRADENTSIAGQTSRELKLIMAERERRRSNK